MKALLAVLLLSCCARAGVADPGHGGAGIILGVPFGATGKYWFDGRHALQGAIGASEGDFVASADFLVHFDDVLPKKRAGRLPLYAGLGLKLKTEDRTFAGFRFVGGVALFDKKKEYEFFAEVAPVVRFAPDEGMAMDGAVGLRRYF